MSFWKKKLKDEFEEEWMQLGLPEPTMAYVVAETQEPQEPQYMLLKICLEQQRQINKLRRDLDFEISQNR